MCFNADFCQVLDVLACLLSKGFLKQDVLNSYLTTSFAVCNFGNTWAMKVISFFQNVLNLMQVLEMPQKIKKNLFLVLR